MKNDVSEIAYCKDCVNNKKNRCVAAGRSPRWIEHYLTSAQNNLCFAKCMDHDAALEALATIGL